MLCPGEKVLVPSTSLIFFIELLPEKAYTGCTHSTRNTKMLPSVPMELAVKVTDSINFFYGAPWNWIHYESSSLMICLWL
jgi:hypothetical protein